MSVPPADGQGQTCTYRKLDLAILIDASDSITADNLGKIGNFVEDLLENLPIGMDESRVLLMSYADSPKTLTKFNTGVSDAAVASAISTFKANPGLPGATKTYKALSKLIGQYTKGAAAGYRGDPSNTVTLLIADGASDERGQTLTTATEASAYTSFFVIGIGNQFSPDEGNTGPKDEMSAIVGCADFDNCDNAFRVDDFN
eukprot:gene21010-31993_t